MSNPALVTVTNLAAHTPAETIELVSRAGVAKGNMRPDKTFLSAVSAGCLLSFACAVALGCNTAPCLTAADLFTGTNMYTTVAALQGRLPLWKLAVHWFICFWGNLAGSLFVTIVIVGYGGVFSASPYKDEAIVFAAKKQVTPDFHQVFLRGIGCNWLVCSAVMLALQAKDLSSKAVAMWFPIFGFVALGFDHVVANMFFIPIGIFLGTPGLTTGLYIWKGIIPSALGNIIGGGLMIGVYYWWIYLFMEAPVAVDSVTFTPSAKSPSWGFGRKGVIQGDEEQCTSDSTETPKGQRSD